MPSFARSRWRLTNHPYRMLHTYCREKARCDHFATVLNNLAALLFRDTNRLADAEPLMRRVLRIDEASFGEDHPRVAIDLNNLAQLLQATNRLTEAAPLMRRVVRILINFSHRTGHEHPNKEAALANYERLLQALGRKQEDIRAELADLTAEP